ncbi:uncharacterized protein DSM5745_11580 [Aspergillus mulundensis]|uniref:Centrosomin N-terminal motif 1 domain-containing protein n=1 Tax=Aspergillus mulundensis TaxID=1810919 RepID=A0A3D8Q5V0_9EURO|nr:Uncharacterized protein DSM5745_11580 [Aspergillus mulundensis]RDW57057.1 Uncharacterized protein DSM5745_11580 [Aspergillus mulundensis]
METPTQRGTDMSWLQDASPVVNTPRTPQRARSHTPEPNSSTIVNPSSALLQDLLKEQRASRGARTGGLEELEDSPRRTPEWCQTQTQSQSQSQTRTNSQEEPGSEKQQNTKMSSHGSVRRPPEMGVRETDQYISKISKQNFDLKLEIFHRVQQLFALEKKLERMQELEDELERMRGLEDEVQELRAAEEDNQRLRESNEQLRQEIDKRDQAVTEAVELICQLEARVEELAMDKNDPRSSTSHLPYDESGVATPRNSATPDIPERTSSRRGIRQSERRRVSSGSRILQRAPSFLLEESKSTAVLRSLYVDTDDHPVPVPTPIPKSESMNSMTETIEPESPRLSALSECSELNIDDTPISEDGYDKIDIPVRLKETSTQCTNLSSVTLRMADADIVHVNRWLPEEADEAPKAETTRRKTRRLSDVFKEPQSSSPSSSSRKSKIESIFGSARLPQTPDTMTTSYPAWANSSSNSTIADKSQSDLRHCLTRPRSADELTARRSSITIEPRESMDINLSKVTFPRPTLHEGDEDPAIFPLNSIQPRYDHSTTNHTIYSDHFERVLARMDKDYYSPSRPTTRDGTTSLGSSPPSMTADDWIEAARPGTRNRTGPVPVNSRLVGARAPSQSSFLGRRHSIDSAVREPTLPIIQTINLRALEDDGAPAAATEPEPEPRRRISLLPHFFNRSSNARRLQPSPISDSDKDDGAPSPVIRKTRNQPPRAHRPLSGVGQTGDFSASARPTDAEDSGMSRSFTEGNLFSSSLNSPSSSTTRPSSSNGGKDQHKRRGSLGIFGWMKGASAGLGSSLKKSDVPPQTQTSTSSSKKPESPVTPTITPSVSASTGTAVRASSRLAAYDNATLAAADPPRKHAEAATEESATFATRTRHPTRTDELADEQGRRPRYMERRSRRT